MESIKRKRVQKRPEGSGYKYDRAFKLKVARLYHEGAETVVEIAKQHGIRHQSVIEWGRQFSAELAEEPKLPVMTEQEQKDIDGLRLQVEALKKKLEYEQMRNFALETMADLAKTELGIDIRKNFGAKQPKK